MRSSLGWAIKTSITLVIVGILTPIGLGLIINATTGSEMSGADSTVKLIWGTLLVILVVLGFALSMMPPELKETIRGYMATPNPALQYVTVPNTANKTETYSVSNFEAIG